MIDQGVDHGMKLPQLLLLVLHLLELVLKPLRHAAQTEQYQNNYSTKQPHHILNIRQHIIITHILSLFQFKL